MNFFNSVCRGASQSWISCINFQYRAPEPRPPLCRARPPLPQAGTSCHFTAERLQGTRNTVHKQQIRRYLHLASQPELNFPRVGKRCAGTHVRRRRTVKAPSTSHLLRAPGSGPLTERRLGGPGLQQRGEEDDEQDEPRSFHGSPLLLLLLLLRRGGSSVASTLEAERGGRSEVCPARSTPLRSARQLESHCLWDLHTLAHTRLFWQETGGGGGGKEGVWARAPPLLLYYIPLLKKKYKKKYRRCKQSTNVYFCFI